MFMARRLAGGRTLMSEQLVTGFPIAHGKVEDERVQRHRHQGQLENG